jgi:hypothetical protein
VGVDNSSEPGSGIMGFALSVQHHKPTWATRTPRGPSAASRTRGGARPRRKIDRARLAAAGNECTLAELAGGNYAATGVALSIHAVRPADQRLDLQRKRCLGPRRADA